MLEVERMGRDLEISFEWRERQTEFLTTPLVKPQKLFVFLLAKTYTLKHYTNQQHNKNAVCLIFTVVYSKL